MQFQLKHVIYIQIKMYLNDQQQFRINRINEIKYYFFAEIREQELTDKRLRKHIVSFDYFDKSLIVLSAASGTGARVRIASVVFYLQCFSLVFAISQELRKSC